MEVHGKIIDVEGKKIYNGVVRISNGIIQAVEETDYNIEDQYILPGFIDAHVHIESSMLTPSEFARLAVVHGTVATVSDPHEIGNVLGKDGVIYMIEDGKRVNFRFYFGAPSCVPATSFETAGAEITVHDIKELFKRDEVKYLAEMMNWPGVLNRDKDVMAKIHLAHQMNKQVDGHAPGLKGDHARKYAEAGITTDHECFTSQEALDKLKHGMKIIIREGSAAKNFEALIGLLDEHHDRIMFCSDDKHPDNLVEGHINMLVRRSLKKGNDLFNTLQAACINPIEHYGLEVGRLRPGDNADFIIIDNLENWNVLETWIGGEKVADRGASIIPSVPSGIINKFDVSSIRAKDLEIKAEGPLLKVIVPEDGQLVTGSEEVNVTTDNGILHSNVEQDVLKLAVVNRYSKSKPAIAFIKNFGLKKGAIASSVAHDSHNIIAVGVTDEDLTKAINLIIEEKGGVSAAQGEKCLVLPLPIAGLMSDSDGYQVAEQYAMLDRFAKELGSTLSSPFMTLSFMALLVIPELKLSDKGLFDGNQFKFVPLSY